MTTPEIQRTVFDRMINVGIDVEVCMRIMAFWIWLESHGFEEIITKISSHDDKFLILLSTEAGVVLSSLQPYSMTPLSPNLMSITPTLSQNVSHLSAIFADKEQVSKDITSIYKGVCCALFKDILVERGIEVGTDDEEGIGKAMTKWISPSYEGSMEQKMVLGGFSSVGSPLETVKQLGKASSEGDGKEVELIAPSAGSSLNPSAKEWNPMVERAAEEDRCLFLTFSNGYPLTESQITAFFTRNYGPCVERVYVHWPEPRNHTVAPLFGKVVFNVSYIPALILGERNEAKFWVDKKPLWCKRFEPNKKIGKP